ncbi:MAG: hypothetical protein QOF87_2332, partial [Pseudonocardiales bacterium]|nr:hypothetical protein [Pseudonocardiales bacterium]
MNKLDLSNADWMTLESPASPRRLGFLPGGFVAFFRAVLPALAGASEQTVGLGAAPNVAGAPAAPDRWGLRGRVGSVGGEGR